MSTGPHVLIVGAGVVGLTAARVLAENGARVTVLDAADPGGRGSRAAAGVAILSVRLLDDPEMLGYARAGREALRLDLDDLPDGAQLRRGQGILRIVSEAKQRDALGALLAKDSDDTSTWVDAVKLVELEPALEGTPLLGAFVSEQGHMVDAEGYVNALLREAARAGVHLRLGEAARAVKETSTGVEVQTDRETLRAEQLLVCAGPWSTHLPGLAPLAVKPVRGQMLLVHQPGVSLSRVVSGPTYLAPWRAGEIVVGATEEDAGFVENVTPAGLLHLSATVARLAPRLREARFVRTWAGLRAVTPDGRPHLGLYPGARRTYVSAGLGGQGILTGAFAGRIVAALLMREGDAGPGPFDPARRLSTG